MCAGNYSRVVDPNDIDGNPLSGAISCSDGNAVCVGDTSDKLIVWRVGRIGPESLSTDTEFSITITALDSSLSHKGI